MENQLVAALEAGLTEDPARLREAAEFLSHLGRESFCWLVEALAFLLSADHLAGPLRQQAGLQLKLIITRNAATFSQLEQPTKLSLRHCLVSSLGTETWRPTTTGLCILAGLEEDWDDLVPTLVRKL